MRKLIVPLLVCLAVLLPTVLAHAQERPAFGPGGFAAQNTTRLTGDVKILHGTSKPGETVTFGIVLKVQSGWKIQAGKGSGDELPDAWPTAIEVTAPEGWTVGDLKWPKAKEFDISGLKATGYSGEVTIEVPVTLPADTAAGEHTIKFDINYQACDATSCEMPSDLALRTTINVSESGEAAQPVTTEVTPEPTDTGPVEPEDIAIEQPVETAPQTATTEVYRPSFFGITIPTADGPAGLVLVIVLSIIGGFLLNLTPCVLPVIPIKIMTISSHAGTPGRSFALGLAMAAGVVAFWVGIGIPAALFTAAADPSRIFGIWYVTLGIGVLIGLMGIGIMGLFTIQLPQAVYSINPKAETASGSFLFGVMTGVLGLPCFGFVAGALLAGSATLPPATIIAIFTSLGVGMAAPYLVLSARPGLVEKIPRTGPASELVKQIMGLLLLAAAAYFIGSGLIALVNELPYLAKQLHWWTVALFATLAGAWLMFRTFQITRAAGKRIAFSVVGIVVAGIAVGFAIDSTTKARSNWLALEAARARFGVNAAYVPGAWNEYTPAAFEAARKEGYVVVLDFTAEWCINCKALKAAVLNRDPVRSELAKDDVVNFTVDLTSTSAPGWQYLKDLGQTGIPLLVIYTPDKNEPWQSNAYTSPQVTAALDAARSKTVARK